MEQKLMTYDVDKFVYFTPEKQLCVLQFSAHEALYVVVNVGQINMTKI